MNWRFAGARPRKILDRFATKFSLVDLKIKEAAIRAGAAVRVASVGGQRGVRLVVAALVVVVDKVLILNDLRLQLGEVKLLPSAGQELRHFLHFQI